MAKIVNATYSDIEATVSISNLERLSDVDTDRTIGVMGAEGELRSALDSIRDLLPAAMVTTYTYDPLVGMTSMTDTRGYTTYYEYDEFNRLKGVRDADGKLVTDYEYHYADRPKN